MAGCHGSKTGRWQLEDGDDVVVLVVLVGSSRGRVATAALVDMM